MSLKKLLVLFLVVISMSSCDDNHQEGFTYSREGVELYKRRKLLFLSRSEKILFSLGTALQEV